MTLDNDNDKGKGKMTVEEAGRKGGETVREKYGEEFYQEIGEKGGNAVVEKYGAEHMAEIGRKGGEASHDERGRVTNDNRRSGRNRDDGDNSSGKGSDKRGFASMSEEKKKEISKKGGESSRSERNRD